MPIADCCTREVVCCTVDTTVQEAAALMRKYHVGTVVVLDNKPGHTEPLGVVTDRDIVIETVATGLDTATFTAGDIMSTPVARVREDAGVFDALHTMHEHGVMRLPVTSARGELVGLVSAVDLLQLLAGEINLLAASTEREREHEKRVRR